MKRINILVTLLLIFIFTVCSAPHSKAEIKSTFVSLGNGVHGVLYEPAAPGEKSRTGILSMHPIVDNLTQPAGIELAKKGYSVLCANPAAIGTGTLFEQDADKLMLDIKLGVQYLRKQPDIKRVIIMAHSMAGGMATAYQNISENGLSACQGPEKIAKCSDELAGLPPADGLVLLDVTLGTPVFTLLSMDPSVVSEDNAQALNPYLDNFNPENGFNPEGSAYSDEFMKRFWGKVRERSNRLIEKAQYRLERINAGKGEFKDDELFIVPGAHLAPFNNRLFPQDTRLLSRTRKAYPLLCSDGSADTKIIHSVRVPEGTLNTTPMLGAKGMTLTGTLTTTVRKFLSTFAVGTTSDFGFDETSIYGIDYNSTYSSTPGSVEGVTVPMVQLGMTGHYEAFLQETIFEHAASKDKTLVFVEGALHDFTPCEKCAEKPGQFGDTFMRTVDFIDSWLSLPGRFQ